ncbi:MAG TPA: hypothetical protein VFM01_14130 [Nakamurella sp.]|nr:hypothetical protein [Nakamurella sp.]
MAQDSWPKPDPANSNKRTVDDWQFERMAAAYSYDGLIGLPSDLPVIYADSSAMQVKIRPGKSGYARGHYWVSDPSATDTVSIGANSSGSTRVDLVVLQLDRSTWSVDVAVHAGTPGSLAPPPTRDLDGTGVYEVPLAEVTVPNGASAISAANVVNRGWYLSPTGLILCTASTRPPAVFGRDIMQLDGKGYRAMADGTWRITLEDTGEVPITVTNTGWKTSVGAQPYVRRVNGEVDLRTGELERASVLLADNRSYIYEVPKGFRSNVYRNIGAYQDGGYACDVVLTPIATTNGDPPNTVMVRGHSNAIAAGASLRMHNIHYPADDLS